MYLLGKQLLKSWMNGDKLLPQQANTLDIVVKNCLSLHW